MIVCVYVYLPNLHILFFPLSHVGARQQSAAHQAWRYSFNKALNTPAPSWTVTEQWILCLSILCRFTLRERLYKAFLTPEHWVQNPEFLMKLLHIGYIAENIAATGFLLVQNKETLYPEF